MLKNFLSTNIVFLYLISFISAQDTLGIDNSKNIKTDLFLFASGVPNVFFEFPIKKIPNSKLEIGLGYVYKEILAYDFRSIYVKDMLTYYPAKGLHGSLALKKYLNLKKHNYFSSTFTFRTVWRESKEIYYNYSYNIFYEYIENPIPRKYIQDVCINCYIVERDKLNANTLQFIYGKQFYFRKFLIEGYAGFGLRSKIYKIKIEKFYNRDFNTINNFENYTLSFYRLLPSANVGIKIGLKN